jgi:hypothetical protein
MSHYATYRIRVEVDHEYGTFEEDRALHVIGDGIKDALAWMSDELPDGWTAEEVEAEG